MDTEAAIEDRRRAPRTRVSMFFNKYIDGYPHLCRTVDVSCSGMLLERVSEPSVDRDFYPIEIGFQPEDGSQPDRIWLWAKQVWANGERQALRFVGLGERERRKLDQLLERTHWS